jgi:hypothetical protein
LCSKELEGGGSKTDTETDTNIGTPLQIGLTGGNSPAAR